MAQSSPSVPVLLAIGTCNRRAGLCTVVDSFRRHHPQARVFVCLVDRPAKEMPPLDIPATLFFADELQLPGGRRFLFKYDAFELCCALKPFALLHVLRQPHISRVLYLDSDIWVMDSFWEELDSAWETHPVLLTPHLVRLPCETDPEFQRSLAQHGAYNGGFIAVKKDLESDRFLHCWARLLEAHCVLDPMANIYVDQRWLDLLAASCAGVAALRDPGLNVAYWNLHERSLTRGADGVWNADGGVLKFFHFSGFDRSRLTTKMACANGPALQLAQEYGQELDRANDDGFRQFNYGWDFYLDGTPIKPSHRDLILSNCQAYRSLEDPFAWPLITALREIENAARESEAHRLSRRFFDQQKSAAQLRRLRRHPVIGAVWKLWERFVNPSLHIDHTPHGSA